VNKDYHQRRSIHNDKNLLTYYYYHRSSTTTPCLKKRPTFGLL